MKKVMKLVGNSFHGPVLEVTSEPGDATLYSYFVYRHGPDEFCFMPCKSTFRFPQKLNYYECKKLSSFNEMAQVENCNPHTLAECIRTMGELWKRK